MGAKGSPRPIGEEADGRRSDYLDPRPRHEHGQPAQGIEVRLFRLGSGASEEVGGGTTDADGRIRRVLDGALVEGEYRIEFSVDGPFFRHAALTFVVADASRSYHVPLLLAPYSMTTYRGS